MFLSSGSPGTTAQWSKAERQKACPCVCERRSVSKPKESITGTKACRERSDLMLRRGGGWGWEADGGGEVDGVVEEVEDMVEEG